MILPFGLYFEQGTKNKIALKFTAMYFYIASGLILLSAFH